ncbi:MAG: hypothetical protein RSG77_18345 [Hafnia sp.]
MYIELIFAFYLIVLGVFAAYTFFPKITVCVLAAFLLLNALFIIFEEIKEKRLRRQVRQLRKSRPDLAERHLSTVAALILKGESPDSFSMENGALKKVTASETLYLKHGGKWKAQKNRQDNPDLKHVFDHDIYDTEQAFIDATLGQYHLADNDKKTLCVLLYFNWLITEISAAEDHLIVNLDRRDDSKTLKFARNT